MDRFLRGVAIVGLTVWLGSPVQAQQGRQATNPISQQPTTQTMGRGNPSTSPQPPDLPPALSSPGAEEAARDRTSRMAVEQEKVRNTDRQKRLVTDTEKLVSLANELKLDVDKSNKDTMSLDVIRKADEIEKLAHSVKEKMKGN